jgi:hypothetical protein
VYISSGAKASACLRKREREKRERNNVESEYMGERRGREMACAAKRIVR